MCATMGAARGGVGRYQQELLHFRCAVVLVNGCVQWDWGLGDVCGRFFGGEGMLPCFVSCPWITLNIAAD